MVCDPLVKQESICGVPKLEECDWKSGILQTFDAIVVAVKQPYLDYGVLETLKAVRVEIWQR